MRKQKVVVLYGGKSAEREISIRTGKQILAYLDRKKYQVIPLEIPQQGNGWVLRLLAAKPDVAFIALHDPFGEDGAIQGMLEMLAIPYTFSGVLTSALAMDKFRLCEFVRGQGIKVPKGILIRRTRSAAVYLPLSGGPNAPEQSSVRGRQAPALQSIKRYVGFPCVVKPNQLGSSVGITVNVKNSRELYAALKLALRYDGEVLVEEYIRGREITAAILGNENPRALPLIEIVAKIGSFYNYESKYADGGSEHIIPAAIAKSLTKKIQALAIKAHALIGAKGVSRSDFILRDATAYFLEINTIPGMTKTSLVPQAAQAAGISFPKLLDQLIIFALQ